VLPEDGDNRLNIGTFLACPEFTQIMLFFGFAWLPDSIIPDV
jgi:hypothetical protein